MSSRSIAACFLSLLLVSPVAGQDWSAFRGSTGDGMTTQSRTPTKWSAVSGVRWSVPMPKGGNGSPVVVGDRVFVTSAEDDQGHTRSLFCFDADSGKQLWKQSVAFDKTMPTHKTNPYGGSTPACGGSHVVVWHGSAGLFAYDVEGNEQWSRDLGEFQHMWGYGTSPVITGDRVILHTGPGKEVFVAAFDLTTGDELWRHTEPIDGNGERNSKDQYMGSWSTPVLIEQGKKEIAVCAFATRVVGLDVQTGELMWFCEGLAGPKGDLAYSSPMIENELCVMMGGFQGPAIGFRIASPDDADRNLTPSHRLWRLTKNPQNIGTGLLIDGHVYRVGAGPNLIECLNAKTGEIKWQERWKGKAFWSSIAFDGTNAYATDQAGTTIVFRPSPTNLDLLQSNPLKDTCNATPALAKGRVYIRTYGQLWCIDGE
ncbi:MAG: PQQ-binding-like beta-propeller repeat protein [Pirellulaceae bacterium]|nr:PQQ-binding-like beta-propeller repeat protein [Pirellulaceae bacterium]